MHLLSAELSVSFLAVAVPGKVVISAWARLSGYRPVARQDLQISGN